MGSLLLKGCTVAVTGDDVAVEDALLLLSWIPVEDVSDAGMTGKESGSHFPVIINTRALYNNKVGRRHMMLQAHLTCDYCWPGDAAAVPDGNERSENSTPPAAAAAAAARVTRPQCRHLSPANRGSTPRRRPRDSPRRRRRRPPPRHRSRHPPAVPLFHRVNGVIAVTPPTTRARFGRQRHAHHPRGDIKLYEKSPRFTYPYDMPVRDMTKKKIKKKNVSLKDLYYCETVNLDF